jgi:hypothetical protein
MTGEYLSGQIALNSTDFKTAISEINRELRVLDSGFKADNASLGDWTKSATGMENRIQSLNQQIELQKNKVANLTAEYNRMVTAHGEGSRAADDVKIKLNTETAALGKMQVEVKTDTAALKEMSTSEKEAGASAAIAGEGIGAMGAITAGVTAIVTAAVIVIGAMIAAVGALGAGIGVLVKTTMNWGRGLDDAMKLLGITSPQAAGLALVSDAVGLSIDDLTLCLDRMAKGLLTVDGKLGSAGKTLKDMGINIKDANGDLRSSPDLLEAIANKLINMKDGTEKVAIEMELFGRGGVKIDEILRQVANGGMQRYIDQAVSMGLALSPDQIDKIHNLGMNINILKDQFTGIAMVLGITFIPVLQSVVTWIGKTVEALMPAIQQWGTFLGMLFGVSDKPAAVATSTVPKYSPENQWRIAHGFAPRADREASGVLPTETTAAGGATPTMFGGPGGEEVGVAITLSPLQQAIMDLRNKVVDDFIPWLMGLDWSGFLTTLTDFDWKTLGTDITTIAGWVGNIATWAAGLSIGGKGIWANQTGTAQGENLSAPQQTMWDFGTWLNDNVITPISNALAAIPGDWAASWQKQVADWLQTNIVAPIMDGSVWKSITGFGDIVQNIKIACYDLGHGINEAIFNLIGMLIDAYNDAIERIKQLTGIQILPKFSQHVVVPKPYASGGDLDLSRWNKVGEGGTELIGPDGHVYPHDISMRLMDLFGNVRGLAAGGPLMPNFGGSIVEAMLNALAQAQQQLARSMGGGFTPMVPVMAGNSSSDYSFYGTTIIQGNQEPGGLGDHLLYDRRY